MHVILKPAGVLLLLGSVASLGALAVIRPIKSNVETLPETKPIEGFTTKKNRSDTFNSKTQMHPVNLTQEGKIDWICWRIDEKHASTRRAAGGNLFSEVKLLSGDAPKLAEAKTGPSRAFVWSDGTNPAPGSVSYPGFHAEGDSGFAFSVNVDTSPHTLTVYVGGYKAGGDFTATVTDGSKATVTSSDIALGEGYYSRAYKVQFRTNSPGQSVRVVWKKSRGAGNISLQAATLG